MIQSPDVNRQIVLTKRPSGEPTTATLRLAPRPVPGADAAAHRIPVARPLNARPDGAGITLVDAAMADPSWVSGILGMPGLTGWACLTQIGQPKPGETVCVAAATGPVGATVGQIAKLIGLYMVGVAGGADKCAHAEGSVRL